LVGLTMLGALLLAPAGLALAQGIEPFGPDASKDPFAYGCPEYAPHIATLRNDPGEGSLLCFRTQAEARHYSLTGEVERADPGTATSEATPAATSTPTATTTLTATPTATGSATATATATASSTATQTPADEQEDERENEQAASEERESRDETTTSEGSREQTRSQDKTTPPETGEVSNRYPITLAAGIALMGLALCGFLATRAILPWRR
jgi:type IV secretory pathway VirJ component